MFEKRNVYRITTLVYIVLNYALLIHHEAWRDEAQAWTIARNLKLSEIIDLLPTEGHLLPFFVILKTWHKIDGAYAWIGLISLAIMTVAVILFLHKAPFHIGVKLLLVFSPIFFYYNAVISRCYVLVVLALILVAMTRKQRQEKMLAYCLSVAFLMQTHILVIPLAVSLTAELLIYSHTRKMPQKQIVMASIPFLSLIIAFMELYQKRKTAFITFDSIWGNLITAGIDPIRERLKTVITKVYAEGRIYNIVLILLVVFLVLLICYIAVKIVTTNKDTIKIQPEMGVCGLGILGYLAIIGIVRECAHIQMALVFYTIIMFTSWIMLDARQKEAPQREKYQSKDYVNCTYWIQIALKAVFVLLIILSYRKELSDVKYDYYYNYSNSKVFAAQAVDYLPPDSVILIRQEDYRISAPYAYIMDKKKDSVFWDVDEDSEFKCIIWGKEYPKKDIRVFANDSTHNTYYLTSQKTEELGTPVLIAEEPNPWQENYYLYDMN